MPVFFSKRDNVPIWAAGPRYWLRLSLVLQRIREIRPGRVLEIGCGAGDLLSRLAHLGCKAHGIEVSEEAFAILEKRFAGVDNPTFSFGDFQERNDTYDAVLAFEVLEHVEDDSAFLRKCAELVRPGGHLLLSVPAHMERWSVHDERIGHYRRYEQRGLRELLERHGFLSQRIDCYGFPLANIVSPLSTIGVRRSMGASREQRTKRSGVARPGARYLRWFCNPITIWPWAQIQKMFLHTQLGNGWLVLACRPGEKPVDQRLA